MLFNARTNIVFRINLKKNNTHNDDDSRNYNKMYTNINRIFRREKKKQKTYEEEEANEDVNNNNNNIIRAS